MIIQFPKLYKDELLYSVFARYYVRSGYLTYKDCFDDLYTKKTRPDIEYLNQMTEEVLSLLPGIEDIILKHTMFPNIRFVPVEKRKKAFKLLKKQDLSYQDNVFKPKDRRYLKYCPICAKNDRKIHGETYWHRVHQIYRLSVCPEHSCYLKETKIPIYAKESASLIAADTVIPFKEEVIKCEEDNEIELAKYVKKVFNLKINFKDKEVGKLIRSKAKKYQTDMGMTQMSFLYSMLKIYYPNFSIEKEWQIRKIFNGVRFDLYQICELAMFLDIKPEELVEYKKPRLPNLKFSHNEKFRTYETDWNAKDNHYYPLIKKQIEEDLKTNKRITIGSIAREAGMSSMTLSRGKLPKCLKLIKKHEQPIEKIWADKLEEAYKDIIKHNLPLHKTQLRRITNIDSDNMPRCIPYLKSKKLIKTIEG